MWRSSSSTASPYLKGSAQPFCSGNSFCQFLARISFFQSWPRANDPRWEVEQWLTGKLRPLLSGSAPSSPTTAWQQTPHQCTSQSHTPIFAYFLTRPKTLKLLHLGQKLSPTHRRHTTYSSERLWPHTLIPVASYSAVSHPNTNWRSYLDEANRTTSSTKSRAGIPRPLQPLATPRMSCDYEQNR